MVIIDFCEILQIIMTQFITSNWLQLVQLAISALLIVAILLQSRGSGLGGAFGSDMAAYSTKRGAEKILFYATIILSVLFFASAFAQILTQ